MHRSLAKSDRDRRKGYGVEYLAKKHSLSTQQAFDLIMRHGNNRVALNAAASAVVSERRRRIKADANGPHLED